MLAGSNITLTWNDAAKTATLTSPLSSTGGTSITTLGTITTGTWTATPITDAYISSAATWNAKQAAGNYLTALTGDVTATGPGSVATTIANQVVTFAKMQHISTAHLLGRHSSGSGDVQQINIDGGLELQGANLRRAALTGDVTASAGSNTTTIANDAVTYAKMQNVSSASRLLGRGSSGAGDVQELTIGTGLAFSGTSLVATGINPFDQDLNTTDAVEFASLLLSAGTIESGVSNLQYTHVGTQGDTPYISVKLNDGSDDIGQTLLGFRGDGSGSGTSFVQGATASFRIEQDGGTLATVEAANISGTNTGDVTLAGTPDYITISGQTITRNAIDMATDVTGVTPVANGGSGANTLAANAVLLGNGTSAVQTVAPGTSGNVLTSNGTTWASAAAATTNPAGSGSELQFRSTGTAFGAVTNSSVSGGTLTLGNAEALATTPTAYLTLRNTTAAAAGAQQVSPSFVLEGRGWKTDATAASQTVRFRQNILPVQGTANPSATWRLQSEINNTGTWTDRLTVTSSGVLTLGTFPAAIVMGNATIFGATNGPRFQVSSSDIFGLRGASGLHIAQAAALGWSNSASDSTEPADLTLFRDAANTLAQRNGTNAQTFRVYNTFTSSTEHERGTFGWVSNALRIGTEKGTTSGALRNISFTVDGTEVAAIYGNSTAGTPNGLWVNAGFRMGTVGRGSLFFPTAGGAVIWNSAETDFTLLRFGGTASSFPALKRSSAAIQARLADDSGFTTMDAQHRLQGTAPATATSTGTAGDVRYDADYIYICVATNTWKRALLLTW